MDRGNTGFCENNDIGNENRAWKAISGENIDRRQAI